MGIGSSVPLKNELKRKTTRTSELVQRILGWMLKESNLLDFYALASPTECKRYVMFTAQNLDSLFKDIQVQPIQGKDQRIYFRKITELGVVPVEIEKQREQNCYKIAYFFIRILQVFGSLALSVMDTELPASYEILKTQAEQKKNVKQIDPETFKQIPLFQREKKQETRRGLFSGGSISPSSRLYIKDQNYSILNRYLNSDGSGYLQLHDEDKPINIKISEDSLLHKRYAFIYSGKDAVEKKVTVVAQLQMRYEPDPSEEKYHVKLYDFTANNEKIFHTPKEFLFKGSLGTDPINNRQTIPAYIKSEFIRAIGGKALDSDASDIKTIKSVSDLPTNINPTYQVKEVWKSLGQKPPIKAFCVARALQLLSPEAIFDSSLKQAARTSICNTKFALQETDSLPTPGKSITTSKSLLTLNLLFFDVLENTIPSISNKQEYKDFLNFMRDLFEERLQASTKDITNIYKNVDGIRETTNPVLCAGKTGPLFTTDRAVADDLRSFVNQLIDRQIKHTENVLKVLEMLFIIREGQPLLLQPAIEEGGIEAVNRVAEVARKLLLSYYSDCEKLYRDGVTSAAARKNSFRDA